MKISDFDFHLPEELIAQDPLKERSASRMLLVDSSSGEINDGHFFDLPKFVRAGDVFVLNNTKVFPARLRGNSETGAAVEIFLINESGDNLWESLARPAKRLRPGKKLIFGPKLWAEVIEKTVDGKVWIKFSADGDLYSIIDEIGQTPLPPYIKRDSCEPDTDRDRYQTVFAKSRGAIAAPTAGLHFTDEILREIQVAGAEIVELTLHVGYGTFEPVRTENLAEHRVLPEKVEISEMAAEKINLAVREGRRIIAVGTTSTRALESSFENGRLVPGRREAVLTITPGYDFKIVDGLITNFHLPQSSLLVLVSTFAGHQTIMKAYEHAVSERYRFYSYGDCMFIF